MNYNVRNEAASEQLDVPDLLDSERVKTARKDILERRKSTYAESMMIGDIAKIIAGMLLHYCGERDLAFTLRYDPRNRTEDKKVFRQIDSILKPLEMVLLGKQGVYLGCSNAVSSADSCGLQMADFLTRDLRALFKEHPQLLSHGATSDLVTSEIGDPSRTIPTVMGGRVFKWGEFIPMPEDLAKAIFSSEAAFSIADYHELLMAKRLSCYSLTGEARIVNLQAFQFETMVD